MKLYWVTTEDHDEDWFVIAESKHAAELFHELSEGYLDGDALAEEISDIPSHLSFEEGWPDDALLIKLGATFLSKEQPRIVLLNGKTYYEGALDGIINETERFGKPPLIQ